VQRSKQTVWQAAVAARTAYPHVLPLEHLQRSAGPERAEAPGVGRKAIASCSQLTRSALEAWPQHMRHSQSALPGMCW